MASSSSSSSEPVSRVVPVAETFHEYNRRVLSTGKVDTVESFKQDDGRYFSRTVVKTLSNEQRASIEKWLREHPDEDSLSYRP